VRKAVVVEIFAGLGIGKHAIEHFAAFDSPAVLPWQAGRTPGFARQPRRSGFAQAGKFYRPRDHEATPFFKMVCDRFDEFARRVPGSLSLDGTQHHYRHACPNSGPLVFLFDKDIRKGVQSLRRLTYFTFRNS
jgi:hypothetical protein